MQTERYSIPGLGGADSEAKIQDLLNTLTVLDGVAKVDVDRESYVVTVQFDPNYMDRTTLDYILEGAGYPSAEGKAGT